MMFLQRVRLRISLFLKKRTYKLGKRVCRLKFPLTDTKSYHHSYIFGTIISEPDKYGVYFVLHDENPLGGGPLVTASSIYSDFWRLAV